MHNKSVLESVDNPASKEPRRLFFGPRLPAGLSEYFLVLSSQVSTATLDHPWVSLNRTARYLSQARSHPPQTPVTVDVLKRVMTPKMTVKYDFLPVSASCEVKAIKGATGSGKLIRKVLLKVPDFSPPPQ